MCGIFGSNFHTKEQVKEALETIRSRGPDQQSAENFDGLVMGCNRLAIQAIEDQGAQQPIVSDSTVMVYNGELWNGFSKENKILPDGKFILESYKELGLRVFSQLDGMFGLCIYDISNQKIILARDFVGEIPLYYYHENDKFCFGSEIKAFRKLNIPTKEIKLLLPGHTLTTNKNAKTLTLEPFYQLPKQEIADNKETIIKNFRILLESSLSKRVPQEVPYCVLLSGGIDSTITSFLLKQHNPNLQAFTVHLGENNSKKRDNDLYYARQAAEWLGIKLHETIVTEEEVLETLKQAIYVIEDKSWTQLTSATAHLLMAKEISKHSFKVVFSGSLSDEIFGSYPNTKQWNWKDEHYDTARRNLFLNVHKNNIIRENKCLMRYSLEPRTPFSDKAFAEYAINIPIKYREEIQPGVSKNNRPLGKRMKPLLRYAFPEIPHDLAWREKVCEGLGTDLDRIIQPQKENIKKIYDEIYS